MSLGQFYQMSVVQMWAFDQWAGTQLGWEAPRVLLQTPQPCLALVLEWEQILGITKQHME